MLGKTAGQQFAAGSMLSSKLLFPSGQTLALCWLVECMVLQVWFGIHTIDRHGNFPRKCKFLRQWNWLSVEKKNCPWGKEIGGTKKKKRRNGNTGFSSAPNTCETYRTRSHEAIACRGLIILNTFTWCNSCGLATGLNAVLHTSVLFQLRKSQCYKSFESEFSGGGMWGRGFPSFLLNQFPCLIVLCLIWLQPIVLLLLNMCCYVFWRFSSVFHSIAVAYCVKKNMAATLKVFSSLH